jgi:hypothetical protein
VRRTAGYTGTGHKTNTEFAKELNITPVLDKIQKYKINWIQHINRTPRKRLPRILKNCTPKGSGPGEDQRRDFWVRETGTGQKVAQLHGSYIIIIIIIIYRHSQ